MLPEGPPFFAVSRVPGIGGPGTVVQGLDQSPVPPGIAPEVLRLEHGQ